MDLKEVKETQKTSKEYLEDLKNLQLELQNAQQQIINTACESENNIQILFSSIIEQISKLLVLRRDKLIEEAQEIKNRDLQPLQDCEKIIANKINDTGNLISLCDNLVNNKNRNNNKDLDEFSRQSCLLGSLPEVPELKEVPFISFLYDSNVLRDLNELCQTLGSVSRIAPVQICGVTEKPGSLLVQWQSIGEVDDKLCDIQEFRLQKGYGNVFNDKNFSCNFHDCYKGPDLQHLVKDLQCNQQYSFRVCGKYDGSFDWTPWSLPQVAASTIKAFSWKTNADYVLMNENKIAKPLVETPKMLLSNGPQMKMGYSVEFTFLEIDKDMSNIFVGLLPISSDCGHTSLKDYNSSTFVMEATGDIYVDNVIKSTKLPEIQRGTKVTFACELINDGKVRINVDSQDKRVTYDWNMENNDKMFFVASFNSSKWKIIVE